VVLVAGVRAMPVALKPARMRQPSIRRLAAASVGGRRSMALTDAAGPTTVQRVKARSCEADP
jgi:hypothetical protein